ncbi:M23 family metallopeptidase [Altericroceibacterium spongiae]|uniref:M23 family metallopeptidase n=1 Tax=Altericroceibacterium spongiae TaxID=2320269 RepID=A0A420ER92_9SPHN|nr:M23 family metallopeptidase [Altericroceibacterium spongiae]RKF23204.1 M23 family metallopeptidase [Altericroceibacterium spongiae]
MALHFSDRLLTIVVTATLTSAVWIVVGSFSLVGQDEADDRASAAARRSGDESPGVESLAGSAGPLSSASGGQSDTVSHADEITEPVSGEMRNLMIPVLNVRPADLVDNFSDENTPDKRLHEAIDIMASEGTSVVSTAPGRIERLFHSQAAGNSIYVRSEDRKTIYYYAHLAEFAPGLQEGQRIRRGQRLGTVGSSGNADPDAPHLHFAIFRTSPDAMWWEPGTALNPYSLLTDRSTG